MKHKFYIFAVAPQAAANVGMPAKLYPVIVKETNKWLEFDDYLHAEGWIKEQRQNGNKDMYQLQKFYVA